MNKIIFILTLFFSAPSVFAEEEIAIIVHVSNPIESITRKDVSEYFFKIKKEWPDGSLVRFIDRSKSKERQVFFEKILKKSEDNVDRFWIGQKLNTGYSAPVQSPSENMSIQFVSTFKGAIGYISSLTTITNKEVKKIKLLD